MTACSSGNMVTNGEDDFESRGFTDSYETDTISVQCIDTHRTPSVTASIRNSI